VKARPPKRPVKVVLAKMADWCGGKQSVAVGEGTQWDLELTDRGVLFWSRVESNKRAHWVPDAAILHVEFAFE